MAKIIWTNRYSGSDISDDLGRWARVGYLDHKSKDVMKQCQIAWIKKLNEKYSAYVYIGNGKFINDFDTLEDAKEYCQQVVNYFWVNYLL